VVRSTISFFPLVSLVSVANDPKQAYEGDMLTNRLTSLRARSSNSLWANIIVRMHRVR